MESRKSDIAFLPVLYNPVTPMPTTHDPLYHHRQCAGKRPYATRREAKDAAKVGTSKYGRPISAYECPCCGAWHVTKLSRVAQRVAREAALRERFGATRR